MEKTIILLKPDALARGMVGEITSRLERKGLLLVGCKMVHLDRKILDVHYSHLLDKPFYERIAQFMMSLPVVVQCWAGEDAVAVVRELTGVTNGREAKPGTIRGDHSMSVQSNLVHASDSIESAKEELARFFNESEICAYQHPLLGFFYAEGETNQQLF